MALQASLEQEVASYRQELYASSTKKAYSSHLRKYFEFCSKLGCPPIPASPNTIAMYSAYLARSLRATSIRGYLNIIRLLHLESGLPNPLSDNWYVHSTLKGIDRVLGQPASRRTPIHPSLLMSLKCVLDLSCIEDVMFWAAALVMFYGLLRKSNLFPDSVSSFDPRKHLLRSDFSLAPDSSISVSVRHSKTNQFHQRLFNFKLLPTSHSLSAPDAIHRAFQLVTLPASAPAFVQSRNGAPMTGSFFNDKLKSLLKSLGVDSASYSTHSFRRGGACWALQCGVPGEIVQQLGDWKSDCYKQYLDQLPEAVHDQYRLLCIDKLPSPP